MEDLILLQHCLYFYKDRVADVIKECQVRRNKVTKKKNSEDFKIYSHLLETNQATEDRCKSILSLIENIKSHKIN